MPADSPPRLVVNSDDTLALLPPCANVAHGRGVALDFSAYPMIRLSPMVRHNRRRLLAWSALLAAFGVAGWSAENGRLAHVPADYTARNWQERDGLPSVEMVGVRQDAQGYLWIVTKSGAARFDGAMFEPAASPAGATLRGFSTVPAGSFDRGTLVLPGNRADGSPEAGCFFWRDRGFVFEPEPELSGKAPRVVFYAPDGARWLACEDGTLLRRLGAHTTRLEPPAGATLTKPPALATDAAGATWVAWGAAFGRIDGTRWVEVKLPVRDSEVRLISSSSGPVWLANRTSLWRAAADGSGFQEMHRLPDALVAHFQQAALEDRNGYLWIGTRSQGLYRLVAGKTLRIATTSDEIAGLCEDSEGSLWVATDGGGLHRLRAQAHQLFDRERGLVDSYSYTVATDARGVAWLANRDGGVARITDSVVDPLARRAGWRQFSARSVFPAPDGAVWIASGHGVFRTHIDRPETLEAVPELATWRNLRVTFVARNGDYWVGIDPDRIARWRHGTVTYFDAGSGFDGRDVRAIAQDAEGRIWVGASGALFRSAGDERFERVPFAHAQDAGVVQALHFESDGRLYVGTTRRGVAILSGPDFSTVRFLDRESGLGNANVSQILVDDHDRTWFATRVGIYWAPGEQLRAFARGEIGFVHTVLLGLDDGVPALSCIGLYQPAAWKGGDGMLWFATRRGVLRTDTAIVARGRDSVPPVSVARVEFDGREQATAGEVAIPHPTRKILLRLSALNLATPESTQLRVRLDGFDEAWTVVGADRTVTYPRLPQGRYGLSTMVSNGGGPWHQQAPVLTFVVHPPWWRTLWFQAAVALALLGVFWAATRAWSHRRLKLRLRAAEHARAIERERTRIARDIHDDIGATLTRISLLTQAAQRQDGPHSATLERIYESTRSVTRALNEIVWAVNPRHDNLESFVYYLGNFAQQFLADAGLRCRLESPNPLPATPLSSQVRHALFLSCREALHNVVKHADATEVAIGITVAAGELTITIADDGRGLEAARATAGGSRLAFGNGLGNMQQHMGELHGRCSVTPRSGRGTLVTFHVTLAPHPVADENPTRPH